MIERRSFDQFDTVDHGRLSDCCPLGHWDARRVGSAMMTCLAIVTRGLLVTATVVAMIAYLLLTNSHL